MFVLLAKNLISYTRLEILIYLALPLLMMHLVAIRCRGASENNKLCFARDDGTLGDNATLNSLYNSLGNIDKPPPVKKLLFHTNKDDVADSLIPALTNILKLNGVIKIKKEGDMTKHLVNGNYLGGVIWKAQGPNTKVTIRFPSALRTWPPNLWETDKRKRSSNLPTSYYRDEGFLHIMNAITAYLIQPDLAKSAQVPDSGVTLDSQPFIEYDGKVDNRTIDFNLNNRDPIKWKREFILIFYLGLLYIYPFIRLVMHMMREKTRQQVDLMNIAGSNRLLHYISWFITSFLILSFISLMTTFFLKAPFCDNGNVLNCTDFTALLFVFLIWSFCGICFCFLVYSLVNNVKLAALIVAFFCILAFLLFAILRKTILSLCILFHYGFLTIIKQILYLEYHDNTGLQWEHMSAYKNPSLPSLSKVKSLSKEDSPVNIGEILGIMIMVAIISLIIAFVAELICPGRYGISICRNRLPVGRPEVDDTSMVVRANNLAKWEWRRPWKRPLRNFNMNMYDDQITVLLGPSDSGKSSAVNLLSRSHSPDIGSVKIDNMDTWSSLNRSTLGLAPQHNALFPNMTVRQHTNFYTSLRRSAWRFNLRRRSTPMESYLRALDLWNVRNVKSRSLSRADKKKLAVANAFAGNPRIILLDEPTEGLEPCERRLVWNLLQAEKRCRTIIVATYHIDEADTLADRVGILCDGQLIFNGSSVFLKNCYGSGYQLICSQGVIYQQPRITSLISKYVPDTVVSCDKDCEMSYNIPQSSCCGIVPLLHALERPVQCVNINTLQIGTTPIVEKYVNASTITGCVGISSRCTNVCRVSQPVGCLLRGWRLCCNQWKAMTLKKLFHIKHNCLLFFLLPLLLSMAFAGLLAYYFYNKDPHVPKYHNMGQRKWVKQDKMKLDLDSYDPPCFYAIVTNTGYDHPLIELVYQTNRPKGCKVEYITDAELMLRTVQNEKHIYAIRMRFCKYETFYSRKWIHSEGVAAAMVAFLAYNKLLDKFCLNLNLDPPIPKGKIEFYNHPYPSLQDNKNSTAYKAECLESDFLYLLLLALSIFSGFFFSYIVRERILGFKLLQKVQGINMATFWLAHLLWDWLFLTLFAAILVALMSIILKKGFSDIMVAYFIGLMFLIWLSCPFCIYLCNSADAQCLDGLFP
ncbi:ATP-binding cassette sub-family A member 12-like [Drosophila serrata]|uniref:ATP-binding cassette sub-family A member 12-like n=1 Tax=Drosophila serrata TaxID=7274 RepID=UPI000A1D256D|nr:ATP-binding cassette sub-family A member 12-like [Drosophila serrata]